jgi:polar amino acid transport system substrate-binding protein
VAYQLGLGTHPPLKEVRLVSSYEPRLVGSIGIGVRKGDRELLGRINQSLARLKAKGTIAKIVSEWKL